MVKRCWVCGEQLLPRDAKGLCGPHYKNLIRRGDPYLWPERAKNGSKWTHHSGYTGFTRNGNRIFEHVEIAEKVLGKKLPDGVIVHHVDCDESNNTNKNLVICPDQNYHMLLHVRTRAYEACGNASWRKCKICKKHDDPKNLKFWGKEVMHQSCSQQKLRDFKLKGKSSDSLLPRA